LIAAVFLLALLGVLLGAALSEGLAGGPSSLIQQGAKLAGGEEESGEGLFGRSVALSADGETALLGAPNDAGRLGAAWVFTRSGTGWAPQGAKLTGGEEESGEARFGRAVALSANGETALVGAPRDGGRSGAVWVFTRTGSTWTPQAKLTGEGESGDSWFGRSVALSADGNTALVGGYVEHDNTGAVWVFTRSGSTWSQQGAKLLGGAEESAGGKFGWSVALSGDGETALIGAPGDGGKLGAAWVFTRSGSTWAQQGAKLTGGAEEGADGRFGWSVALSADGETALIGANHDEGGAGAVWVFTRSGSTWAQQGAKLTGGGEQGKGEFGDSVALSEDGATALIGGHHDDGESGAAWVFTDSGSTWAQQGAKLTGGEEQGKGEFGWSVGLSGDGGTALIGGPGDAEKVGAAWVFATPAPVPAPGSSTVTVTVTSPVPAISPSTTTSAKQGIAGTKAAGGRVLLASATVIVRRNGRAQVKLECAAAVTCRGNLRLTLRVRVKGKRRARTIGLGTARFVIAPGRTSIVEPALGSAGRSRLRAAHGRLAAGLAIAVSSPGPSSKQTHAVRLVLRAGRARSRARAGH